MKKAKILYVDMDDVTADFTKAAKDPVTGRIRDEMMFDKDFFLNLEPVPGAKKAIFQLSKFGFDIWILSQPFTLLPESYAHKAEWIQRHFPQLTNKIILTQDKGLNVGDYLIDDNYDKWNDKFEARGGTFIHFPYGGYNSECKEDPEVLWKRIVNYFKLQNPFLD